MMYEMLTGFPPFSGSNSMKVLLAHLDDPPRPIGVGFPELGVPAEVDAFVLKLLSKDPASRPASAREARIELERLLLAVVGPLSGSALVEHLRSSERASDVGLAAVGAAQAAPGTPRPPGRAGSRTAGGQLVPGSLPAATVPLESAGAWDRESPLEPTLVDVPAASPTSATALAYYIALSVGVLGVALMAIAWILER
jgi:serine/threonine protein kinase